MAQSNSLSPQESEKPFESQRKLWQLKFLTMERFLEGEKKSVQLSIGEEQIDGAQTLRNESEERR